VNKNALLSLTLLVVLVANVAAMAIPVSAAIEGTITITKPDYIVPGGCIEVEITEFSADGGTIYFYLSEDDEPEISSGDIRIASISRDDVEEELPEITIQIPTTVNAGEYYVKMAESRYVGRAAIVSDNTVEVLAEEDWPTITIDPTSGNVGETPEVEGKDIVFKDFEEGTADFYWKTYEGDLLGSAPVTEDGEIEEFELDPIPNSFMGVHKVVVLLTNEDGDKTLGTYVEFEVEPDLTNWPADTPPFSIEAEASNQEIVISGSGFPEGTVEEDSIKIIVKDFETGETLATLETEHEEFEIGDEDQGWEDGEFLDITLSNIDYAPEGEITIQIKVDGKVLTFEDQLLASQTRDPGDFDCKMDITSGISGHLFADGYEIEGDTITFTGIGFSEGSPEVIITFEGDFYSTGDIVAVTADENGAWRFEYTLEDIPGGVYDVRITSADRYQRIGEFTVTPHLEIDPDEGNVEDSVNIYATGCPVDSEFDTVIFGTEEIDIDPVAEAGDVGFWDYATVTGELLEVPHISGGGKAVEVVASGEDRDGEEISISTEFTLNPVLLVEEWVDAEEEIEEPVGVLETDGSWTPFPPAAEPIVFPGNPVRIVGWGFLAGESVKVKLGDYTLDITDGGKADSNGDLILVARVPSTIDYEEEYTLTVSGTTDTNKADLDEKIYISEPNDVDAKIFFGLQPDGSLLTVEAGETLYVGDKVDVVGVGFERGTVTLRYEKKAGSWKDLVDVKVSRDGILTKTITLPELIRGEHEFGVERDGDLIVTTAFEIKSKIEVTPTEAYVGDTVKVKGTGFGEEEEDVLIYFGEEEAPELFEAEVDENGSFEETFTVPYTSPARYKIIADVPELEEEDDPYVWLNVLDVWKKDVTDMLDDLSSAVDDLSETVEDLKSDLASLSETAASKEALAALSDKVSALESSVADLKSALDDVKGTAEGTKGDVSTLKSDVADLKSAVDALKSDVSGLAGLPSKVDSVSSAVSGLKADISEASSKAEAAATAAGNLTTLLYIAIIFSLLAFVFAIVSVVQLSRKIA